MGKKARAVITIKSIPSFTVRKVRSSTRQGAKNFRLKRDAKRQHAFRSNIKCSANKIPLSSFSSERAEATKRQRNGNVSVKTHIYRFWEICIFKGMLLYSFGWSFGQKIAPLSPTRRVLSRFCYTCK